MKKNLLTVLVLAACVAAPAMADNRIRTLGVTQLGQREGDVQMLNVQCRPRVASIKLRATRNAAELERVFVMYNNGERESVPVRRYLDRGQETRWLDLTGRRRCVTGIGIIGDTERGWEEARRDDDRHGRDDHGGRRHGRGHGRGNRAEIEVLGRY